MRQLIPLLSFFPFFNFAQVSFSEHIIDTSAGTFATSKISPGDFNSDGFTDIATLRKTADELAFYMSNGTSFGARQVIPSSLDYPIDVCSGDFNSDGKEDLATIELQGKAVQVFFNQSGGFAPGQKIDSNVFFGPAAIFSTDFTNDNIPDILAVDDTVVYLYENDGSANFTRYKVAGQTEFYSAGVADINGDSLPDILLGSIKLYTYLNNGDGTFTRDTRNEPLINDFIFEIELADIDFDGDNDMAIYYSNTNSNIDWYSNDGTGKFTLAGSITSTANDVHSMCFGDFNRDNYPDFVTGYGQTGDLVWIPNNNGTFGNEIVLKTYNLFTREVAVADVDQDGDLDIFCGQHMDGLFLWVNQSAQFSLAENKTGSRFYPNPSSGAIHIKVQTDSQLKVLSVNGQTLQSILLKAGENAIHLNLAKGSYILKWQEENYTYSEKLIIQ
ncbi:FG-GAP-like repeat-containing protein [Owenweeksia hongkongensis]|uniref:FG-GAP-like repeat-containing protein n=1 Tax=Owenweeksia hongkongensis TaxID=253245 RepID=UPI003A90215D